MKVQANDLLVALMIGAAALALYAVAGFPALEDVGGDNDSLMRLVQIRALLDGQGWFDLQQYRMGLEGGFALHWSRLVDLPIAGLMLSARALGFSPALAETFALVAWPLILFVIGLYLLADTVRRISGAEAVLPAFVLGAAALYFTSEFAPGAIDHHNIQLVLVLAMVNCLLRPAPSGSDGLLAGLWAALSIAIGMETAPYVAAAGGSVALLFLFRCDDFWRLAAGFGAAFAAVTTLAVALLVDPVEWLHARCDALSNFQLTVAVLGGLGLAAAASFSALRLHFHRRVLCLGALGLATLAVVTVLFPQCLAPPFADLDPRIRELWLDHVSEAQSLPSLFAAWPFAVLAYFVTPAIGLALIGITIKQGGASRGMPILTAILGVALIVSAWQVRGSTFSIPLAVIPLAVWIGTVRSRTQARVGPWTGLALIGTWLVSTNAVWTTAGGLLGNIGRVESAEAKEVGSACYARMDYDGLGKLPPGTVLAVSNHGAPILAYTHHRALAGPYHRNQAGNLAVLDTMMATPEAARERILNLGVDYVAICPHNPETRFLASRAPDGLLATLTKGEAPDWLPRILNGPALIVHELRTPHGE